MKGLLSLRAHFKIIKEYFEISPQAVLLYGKNTKRNISIEDIDSQSYSDKSQGRSLVVVETPRTNPGCITTRAARILALRFVQFVQSFPGSGRRNDRPKQVR
jgi:hypothetical protein